MKTLYMIIWFTKHSWSYLRGERGTFFRLYFTSLREFLRLWRNDEKLKNNSMEKGS